MYFCYSEYVKNLNNIYKYNCRKKNDFIKKGLGKYYDNIRFGINSIKFVLCLDLYRKDNSFMKKFPSDVAKAESLTGGDPEIITSEVFAPERRTSYAQIFGTPSPKKSPKFPGRGRPSLSNNIYTVTLLKYLEINCYIKNVGA